MDEDKSRFYFFSCISASGILLPWLYLKATGQVPGPDWGLWNYLDFVLMKIFYFLLFSGLICLAGYLLYYFFVIREENRREVAKQESDALFNSVVEHIKKFEKKMNDKMKILEDRIATLETKKLVEETLQELPPVILASSEVNSLALQSFI